MKYLVSRLRAAFATPVRAATAREPYTLPRSGSCTRGDAMRAIRNSRPVPHALVRDQILDAHRSVTTTPTRPYAALATACAGLSRTRKASARRRVLVS